MPTKNVVKMYVKNGIYHVYNRGVDKRTIFESQEDYKVFLKYLKDCLDIPDDPKVRLKTFTLKGLSFKGVTRQVNNYTEKIDLLAYCLMPNHFHLMVKQNDEKSLKDFMKSLLTRYVVFFNKRHGRVGPLFQDTYKAVLVNDESYLLHLSRYIHLNPSEITNDLAEAHSSYAEYLHLRKTNWIKPSLILSYFENKVGIGFVKYNSYKKFVESNIENSANILGDLILED